MSDPFSTWYTNQFAGPFSYRLTSNLMGNMAIDALKDLAKRNAENVRFDIWETTIRCCTHKGCGKPTVAGAGPQSLCWAHLTEIRNAVSATSDQPFIIRQEGSAHNALVAIIEGIYPNAFKPAFPKPPITHVGRTKLIYNNDGTLSDHTASFRLSSLQIRSIANHCDAIAGRICWRVVRRKNGNFSNIYTDTFPTKKAAEDAISGIASGHRGYEAIAVFTNEPSKRVPERYMKALSVD